MPKTTIPLVFNPSQRGFGSSISMSKDAIMSGVVPVVVSDSLKGSKSIFVQKRTGLLNIASTAAGSSATAIFLSQSIAGIVVAAFGSSLSTIYRAHTSVGTLATATDNYTAMFITETVINDITYFLITANDPPGFTDTTGWYLASDAHSQTSYTGDTHSNTTIDNIASTAGMYVGQAITGSGIPANTRIATITSATAITITQAATATAAGVTLTKTPVALILDADFPTSITGAFVSLNGYTFIMTTSGRIYQSGLNNINSWGASNYVPSDLMTDDGIGLARVKNNIIAFGGSSAEVLENVGNPSGSVLLSRQGEVIPYGARRNGDDPRLALIACDGFRAAWVADDGQNIGSVFLYDDKGYRAISAGPVSNILDGLSTPLTISLIATWGQSFVHVGTQKSGAENLLYSIENDLWVEANFPGQLVMSGGSTSSTLVNIYAAEVNDTNGITYRLANSSYQDNSTNYSWTITTDNYSLNNGEPFIITHIDLIGDTESSGSVTIQSTEDDYQNFADLGTFDLTQSVKRVDGCGWYPSTVAFKLTETANRQWRGQAIAVYWVPCGRPN